MAHDFYKISTSAPLYDTIDVRSFPCPFCNATVKYLAAQDENEALQNHYDRDCKKCPPKEVKARLCSICSVKLGLSNAFKCPKCQVETCMAHRLDHQCKTAQNRIGGSNNISKGGGNSSHISNSTHKPKTNNKIDNSTSQGNVNASKGRKPDTIPGQQSTPTTTSTSQFLCPFCGISTSNEPALVNHIDRAHPPEPEPATVATSSPYRPPSSPANAPPPPVHPPNTSMGREVCPICQERFTDPILLVQHFETRHPQSTSTSSSSSSSSDNCRIS